MKKCLSERVIIPESATPSESLIPATTTELSRNCLLTSIPQLFAPSHNESFINCPSSKLMTKDVTTPVRLRDLFAPLLALCPRSFPDQLNVLLSQPQLSASRHLLKLWYVFEEIDEKRCSMLWEELEKEAPHTFAASETQPLISVVKKDN